MKRRGLRWCGGIRGGGGEGFWGGEGELRMKDNSTRNHGDKVAKEHVWGRDNWGGMTKTLNGKGGGGGGDEHLSNHVGRGELLSEKEENP